MRNALKDARITADKIDYINAHATSTGLGDLSELNAIKTVFDKLPVVVGATKSMTGHLLGAAGGGESLISVLSLKNSIIPPTMKQSTPAEKNGKKSCEEK